MARYGKNGKTLPESNYPALDIRAVNRYLFYPRGGEPVPPSSGQVKTIMVPVEEGVIVGGKCHIVDRCAPNILFFHGNGEIVSDYDDFAPFFLDIGFNFIPVDYRGYGFSTGFPSVTSMMRDGHVIFNHVADWLVQEGMPGPLVVMGRSLGSASALEIAGHYEEQLGGLIIDSGFAYTGPLLENLGLDTVAIGFVEENGLQNLSKISRFHKPTLVVHGENDEIIDVTEARKLYETCPAAEKKLLVIHSAGHNDLFIIGQDLYRESLAWLKNVLM